LIKKNQKIKTAPARAKIAAPRLNGNELASLKQISVLIAFVQEFINARSDEVGSSFAARRPLLYFILPLMKGGLFVLLIKSHFYD
jgi:hypothetical protein